MVTRREFMKGSLAAGVAAAVPFSPVQGANDDIRVAVAGINGQGRGLIGEFRDIGGVRVVALCDVDGNVLEREVKKFKGRNEKVDAYGDYRRMLQDKSIDVVAIATPDHWHVPLAAYPLEGHDNGNIFYGDKGTMSIGRRGWQVTFKDGKEGPGGGRDGKSHAENFIKAVRSRKAGDLSAGVEEGHHSAALCHLANIAMRLGRRLRFDTKAERFIGDDQANGYLTKEYRKGYELPSL